MPESPTTQAVTEIVRPYQGRKGVLLEVFHRVQEEYGYIPPEAMEPIAKALGMRPSTVFGSLTFYTELRTTPPPPVQINMCLGPTCHINGADTIRAILEHRLGISGEEGSEESGCGIHVIQCAGHCHLAPLLYVNNLPRTNVKVAEATNLADEARRMAGLQAVT